MVIQIDGTNRLNKGAELMLYSVLAQIEKVYPQAEIVYNAYDNGYKDLDVNQRVTGYLRLRFGITPSVILSKFKLPNSYFTTMHPSNRVDILLDGSGFKYGDQWNRDSKYVDVFESYMKNMKKANTRIIFLPQALGPFRTPNGKRVASIIEKYADLVIAREDVSYKYFLEVNPQSNKTIVSTDFTNLLSGTVPANVDVKGKVCIIPNKKMVTHGGLKTGAYLDCVMNVIQSVEKCGYEAFLLNHEGEGDLEICRQINGKLASEIPIISGLNAKEIKGVIGQSYAVFSSRFHGVASALSQSIPCIATSWSHKYQLLFEDYGLENQVLDVDTASEEILDKMHSFLDSENNGNVKQKLQSKQSELKQASATMWDKVWAVK